MTSLDYSGSPKIHPSVCEGLQSLRLSPVLPNLQQLNWWGVPIDGLLPTLVAENSSLLSMDISLRPESNMPDSIAELQAIVHKLHTHGPRMQRLRLTDIPVGVSLQRLAQLKHLHDLLLWFETYTLSDIRPGDLLTWDTFHAMSPFDRFRRLDIDVSNLHLPSDCPSLLFVALEMLTLRGPLSLATALLVHIQSDTLMSLNHSGIDPDSGLPALLNTAPPFPHLCHLRLEVPHTLSRYPGRDILSRFLLSPRLQTLDISCTPGSVLFSKDDFVEMAHAWPQLTELSLTVLRSRDIHVDGPDARLPSVPLSVLEAFARHCPELREWSAPVIYDTPLQTVSPPVAHENLESLFLSTPAPDTPTAGEAARFVYSIFPSVQTIYERAAYRTIEAMVRCLRMGRQDFLSGNSEWDSESGEGDTESST